MINILVTGANGFIGSRLCTYLLQRGAVVRGTVREPVQQPLADVQYQVTGSISGATDWNIALKGIEVVYHLAATVHKPELTDPAIYQTTIVDATVALAQQAAMAGVKRLVFLSTASVYGAEGTATVLTEASEKQPITPYGAAKLAAEIQLQTIAKQTDLEVVIVRPPLVYGLGAPGNFAQLVKLTEKLPLLPLGLAVKKRSFIGIDNLLDFLYLCATHPAASNQVFNISDDVDLSTRDFCRQLLLARNKKCLLLPIPATLMWVGLKTIGKAAIYKKLFEAFQLDIAQAKTLLNWKPAYNMQQQVSFTSPTRG